MSTDELSPYELQRLLNVQRNQQVLKNLGLVDNGLAQKQPAAQPRAPRRALPPPSTTRELRTKRSSPDYTRDPLHEAEKTQREPPAAGASSSALHAAPRAAAAPAALSIKQPFASGIMQGRKRLENRTWRPRMPAGGGRGLWIAVHASAKAAMADDPLVVALRDAWPDMPSAATLPRSAVLGFMHVSSVVSVDEMSGEPQAVGPWCWLIDDSRRSPPRADRPRRQCLAERRAHAGRADAAQPAQRGPVREGLLPCLEGVVRRVEARGAGAQRATPLLSAAARLAAAVDVERSPRESRAPRLGGTVRAAAARTAPRIPQRGKYHRNRCHTRPHTSST